MLDYYVVTSLSAKSSKGESFRTFYCERVAMYKALCAESADSKTGETGGLRFLMCWTGGCACFQVLRARGRSGFRLGPLPTSSRARCRLTS